MNTYEIPQFSTPSRQETPSRQDLLMDCIEDRLCRQIINAAKAQTLTYLRLTNLKLGLLLNFGQSRLVDGLSRIVNGL